MSDIAAIEVQARRLIYSYARALDRLDRELLAGLFHDNARVELGSIYQGAPAGFVEVAMGFMGGMAATRHDVGNILVSAEGRAAATIEAYVQAWHRIEAPDGTCELIVYGRYLSRIAARGSDWRFIFHSEVIDWGRELPVDPGWFDGNAEMPKGRRDRQDASYALFA